MLQSSFDPRDKEESKRPDTLVYGSVKKASESVSRYVERPIEPYEIPWQATFMSRATEKLLFVRGKYNMLDVIDAQTLKYV